MPDISKVPMDESEMDSVVERITFLQCDLGWLQSTIQRPEFGDLSNHSAFADFSNLLNSVLEIADCGELE